ncbi:MAG: cytochrome c-type biogenesis protein CcmH [Actinomycetota bacterium]|nr:cytochrome c-type biogenesis protein CcmH [Actinomycetota bacterium]
MVGTAASSSAIRRWAPWAAMAVVLALALGIGSWPHGTATLDSRARAIDNKLRCPSCESQSVASSDSPAANAIRIEVRRRLALDQSEDQITDFLVGHYGEAILLEPSRSGIGALVWILPVVVVVVAFAAIGFRFRGWRARPGTTTVSADDQDLVDAARSKSVRP